MEQHLQRKAAAKLARRARLVATAAFPAIRTVRRARAALVMGEWSNDQSEGGRGIRLEFSAWFALIAFGILLATAQLAS